MSEKKRRNYEIRQWLLCLPIVLGAMGVNKERPSFKSSEKRVHLVELFSTQSCSSCPPAQSWVSTLRGNKGPLENVCSSGFACRLLGSFRLDRSLLEEGIHGSSETVRLSLEVAFSLYAYVSFKR